MSFRLLLLFNFAVAAYLTGLIWTVQVVHYPSFGLVPKSAWAVFHAAHTRRMSYDRARCFSAWLFAVARYKMIDHFRRTRQTCPLEAVDGILASESFEDDVNARMDIARLMELLPEKQARAIRQTRIEGHSVAETARQIGIGESDVKVSVHRGLKALAARIRGDRT